MTASKLIKSLTRITIRFDCGIAANEAAVMFKKSGVYYEKSGKSISLNIRPFSDDSLVNALRIIGLKG